jgi:hypothetical protein
MKKVLLSTIAIVTMVSADSDIERLKTELHTMQEKLKTLEEKSDKAVDEETMKKHFKVINAKSPEFLLGKQTGPNMTLRPFDNPDMWVKLGVRIQGTFENYDSGKDAVSVMDAYLRRTRFEIQAGFSKNVSFTMDVRNDKANYRDKGEQGFNVGDAYLKIKKPFDTSLVNFKLYRGKIDVSRTETVKSAYVIHYDRPHVADEAAQYITHNRRGTNAKMYGDWHKKLHYEVAFGDGVYSGKLKDASGSSFKGKLKQKSSFYGGKVVLSPFDGWEERKRTESYFGEGKHFSIGAAYWISPDIDYDDGTVSQTIDHKLLNLEISAHYLVAFVQAEYFNFDGVVKDWGSPETGKSNGWYATGEYLFTDAYYLAPFVRVESWDKWDGAGDYTLKSNIVGLNWYLRGNSTKVGLAYQQDKYGKDLGDYTDKRYKLTTQWFF